MVNQLLLASCRWSSPSLLTNQKGADMPEGGGYSQNIKRKMQIHSHHISFALGRMARGGLGSPGSAMPYPSTPCGRATPETALRPIQGWPAYRVGSLRPSSTPLDTPRLTPMVLLPIAFASDHDALFNGIASRLSFHIKKEGDFG
jgi:hypothetical protein